MGAAVFAVAQVGAGRARREAAQPPALPSAAVPGAGARVLVVSPHPDDETLGLGGLIRQARRRGARVEVVFLTNGEGFVLAGAAKYRRWPGPDTLRRLARDRQSEARAALSELAVEPRALTFLGYPDRGLAQFWMERWTEPYRSSYTGQAAVAPGSLRPGAAFSGRNVLQDLEAVLRRTDPTHVYYPDSTDDHPDHWATACFTRMALERVPARRPRAAATYLIHRGSWPRPLEEDRDLFLHAPPELAPLGMQWRSLPVDADALSAKGAALDRYASQEALAGNFLNAFLRRNELVALPVEDAAGGADAVRDRWGRSRWGGADFTALRLRERNGDLLLTAELREAPLAGVTYTLSWKPVEGPPEQAFTRTCRLTGFRAEPEGSRFSVSGRTLTLRIPPGDMVRGAVMVNAAVWSGPVLLDRTPWWVVREPFPVARSRF